MCMKKLSLYYLSPTSPLSLSSSCVGLRTPSPRQLISLHVRTEFGGLQTKKGRRGALPFPSLSLSLYLSFPPSLSLWLPMAASVARRTTTPTITTTTITAVPLSAATCLCLPLPTSAYPCLPLWRERNLFWSATTVSDGHCP